MRTIYDGLSFEVVKEAETFLGTRGITSSATGEANLTNYTPHDSDHTRGTRYYFIRDGGQELRTGKSGEALPNRTKGVRTYLYLNGEPVAVNNLYNTNHGQYYYGSDILGSVRFITGQAGQELKRIEYDVFGGIYKGNSPYGLETGYTGKPYDAVTGLSDYGFRDYSPTHARFITEDPIRDGENWFSYVGNNPVNWVDPWGLSASDGQGNNENANLLLSGLTKTLSGSVKTVTGLAGAAAGMLASAALVADNGTVVLTVDDAALLVTVPVTAASGKYALNGAKEAVDGLTDLTAGVVGTTKTLGTWIGDKAKSALNNIFQSNNNDKLKGKPGEIKRNGKQETKIGTDGRAIKERHNTDHGNPKVHTNPHDHDITWDEEGNPVYSDPINYPDDAPPFE